MKQEFKAWAIEFEDRYTLDTDLTRPLWRLFRTRKNARTEKRRINVKGLKVVKVKVTIESED